MRIGWRGERVGERDLCVCVGGGGGGGEDGEWVKKRKDEKGKKEGGREGEGRSR